MFFSELLPLFLGACLLGCSVQDTQLLDDVRDVSFPQHVPVAARAYALLFVWLQAAAQKAAWAESVNVELQRLQRVPLHIVL